MCTSVITGKCGYCCDQDIIITHNYNTSMFLVMQNYTAKMIFYIVF